jgi:Cu+-exporting ATPase
MPEDRPAPAASDSQDSSFLAEFGAEYGYAAVIGVLLLLNVTGVLKYVFGLDTAIFLTLMAGYKTFYNSISALLQKTISADLALCVAVIAALSVGEYAAAAEAMFIVMVGETIESYAAGRTEAAIRRFVAEMPRVARLLLADGSEKEVDAASLAAGDVIVTRAGERIAADGTIERGASSIDQSSITGEPLPADKQIGDEVFSGSLNGHGLLHIRVTRMGDETTLARVIHLVEEAKQQRAPVERLADRYAKYFLPALLLSAALTYYFTGNWLRTVAVLIVACPCALILATPTAMVAAIGGLARRGILVRGGAVLQRAAQVDTAVFDKTGTLTEGRFEIAKIIASNGDENSLIALAASAEQGSDHALARVIVAESEARGLLVPRPDTARVLPGRGVEASLEGRVIRAGNSQYMAETGIRGIEPVTAEADRLGATAILIADGVRLAGAILLRDRIRDGAREAVAALPEVGITNQIMLTGDRRRAAEVIAHDIGIHAVEAELLPEQKLDRVRQLTGQGRHVAMLGDGINDAAALAASSVGIAVSGASDITAEAADVVYMPHSLERLPRLFEVSRRAMQTAWLNIVLFAGALNGLAVLACATGKIGPIGAAFTHQLSSFFVMMNSLRLLRVERISLDHGVSRGRFAGWCVRCAGDFKSWAAASPLADAWNGLRGVNAEQVWNWVTARRKQLIKSALLAAGALIVVSGFYAVQPDEVGVIERFGRKVTPLSDPGLHYKLPWPVDRLTRIQAHRVRVVEIGFRSNGSSAASVEPAAYEWNVQHRSGRFESRPEESLMFTGDQNMIELNAAIHYQVEHPDSFLFRQMDPETVVRAAGESAIHGVVGSAALDEVLTTGRQAIEARALAELQGRLNRYETGVRVLRVKLLDVHPSIEVVDAFRDVSAAFEEKNRAVNEAEGYRNERVAVARGNAKAQVQNANSYTLGRINRSEGDASRFTQQEQAYRTAPGPTGTRLYLETMEQVLAGKKKVILDASKGRRHLLLLEDGVEIAPPGAGILGTRP